MSKELTTVDDVKNKLKIESFDSMTEKQRKKADKLLPKLDKSLAAEVICLLPDCADITKTMISGMTDMCDKLIEHSEDAKNDAISAYKTVLESLAAQMKDELTYEQKREITDKMTSISESIAEEGEKHREYMRECKKDNWNFLKAIGGTAMIAAAIIISAVIKKPND